MGIFLFIKLRSHLISLLNRQIRASLKVWCFCKHRNQKHWDSVKVKKERLMVIKQSNSCTAGKHLRLLKWVQMTQLGRSSSTTRCMTDGVLWAAEHIDSQSIKDQQGNYSGGTAEGTEVHYHYLNKCPPAAHLSPWPSESPLPSSVCFSTHWSTQIRTFILHRYR